MNKLVAALLNKEKSVRETIDEFASVKKLEAWKNNVIITL